MKAAYLSTVFATRVEERNMIYLGPLLIVGGRLLHVAPRWLPGSSLAARGFVAWLVPAYGYQLDYPYFEAPGYGIAAMANRSWHWDQPTIRHRARRVRVRRRRCCRASRASRRARRGAAA